MYDTTKSYKYKIREAIRSTWNTPYVRVHDGLYATIERKISLPEVDHTDGIGTKGWYHWQRRTFKEAVVDALAMNLNDLLLVRATAYKLQNHITLPADDHEAILAIVHELADVCKERKIALTGGETSIHADSHSLEISITVTGFVEHPANNQLRVGDVLIGLPSSGLHSNGFTKVRELFGEKIRPEFTKPTTIYVNRVQPLLAEQTVHGMMHITGGAYTKLLDVLPADADVQIAFPENAPNIFDEIFKQGVTDEEMYKTFNCGWGFIVSVAPAAVERVCVELNGQRIGQVVPGKHHVQIQSQFTRNKLTF
ncbi:MAG: AIR synthase-related protein [Patescibacteria group bacterium]